VTIYILPGQLQKTLQQPSLDRTEWSSGGIMLI